MSERVPHMRNWFDSIRFREAPIAPIDAGHAHAVAVIMSDQAMVTGQRQIYDAARREIRFG